MNVLRSSYPNYSVRLQNKSPSTNIEKCPIVPIAGHLTHTKLQTLLWILNLYLTYNSYLSPYHKHCYTGGIATTSWNAKTQNVKHLHIINYFECKSLGIGIEIKINGEVD